MPRPYYVQGIAAAEVRRPEDGRRVIHDGLWCAFCDVHMGRHAEYTAKKAHITREAQDEFAAASHRKAVAAIEAGKFKDEIAPVQIASRKGTTTVDTDESPRKDTSVEALSKLRPAFPNKDGSTADLTVTAGNAPGLNDGASCVGRDVPRLRPRPRPRPAGRVTAYATGGGGDPKDLFFAPIVAVRTLLTKSGRATIGDYDLIEANEASPSRRWRTDGRSAGTGIGSTSTVATGRWPPHRRLGCACAYHAASRAQGPWTPARFGHTLSGRRRCRRSQRHANEIAGQLDGWTALKPSSRQAVKPSSRLPSTHPPE